MSGIGKYSGYLICTDIDGTLVDSKGEISPKNLAAIEDFQANGGLFTVSTGRLPDYVRKFAFRPNAPVIAVNGTLIADPVTGRRLREFPLACGYGDVLAYIESRYGPSLVNAESFLAGDTVICEEPSAAQMNVELSQLPAYKILFRINSADTAAAMAADLNRRFAGRYVFDRSWQYGVEMHTDGSGKGPCALLLKEKYCAGVRTLIAVGDYENDISMLRAADIGYATGNAPAHVKSAADALAPSNDKDAISFVIGQIESSIS